MNKIRLRDAALALDRLLAERAATDSDAASLHKTLRPMLLDAAAGQISKPIEWRDVPGDRMFAEGTLRKYSELESAYATFKIEVTGGETDVLRTLRSTIDSGRQLL